MNIKKFILNLLILYLLLAFTTKVLSVEPVPDFRLNTVISQANDFSLSLDSIGLEPGPSLDYGLDYPSNFFLIKIVDKNNLELFQGKILKSYQTLPPDLFPIANFTPETIIANPINLFLPYFNEATKVQFFDENNALKLEIILADHNLQGLKYRFAACDLCGYCPAAKPPSTWEKCRQCLYPNASKNPSDGDTLRISEPNLNTGPTTFPDKAFTGIGCIGSTPEIASQAVLNIIFSIVGGVAFLALLYGAFIVSTSQAEAERLNYGKRIIRGAIIGLIVTLLSVFIVNFIASGILKIPGFGSN